MSRTWIERRIGWALKSHVLQGKWLFNDLVPTFLEIICSFNQTVRKTFTGSNSAKLSQWLIGIFQLAETNAFHNFNKLK